MAADPHIVAYGQPDIHFPGRLNRFVVGRAPAGNRPSPVKTAIWRPFTASSIPGLQQAYSEALEKCRLEPARPRSTLHSHPGPSAGVEAVEEAG